MMPEVSVLRERIIAYCDTARPMQDILDHMGGDRDIIKALILQMTARRELMIAPGTNGKQWIAGAKARLMLRQMDGEA